MATFIRHGIFSKLLLSFVIWICLSRPLFYSVNIGLYSINALRQRPFLSTGKYLNNYVNMVSNISGAWPNASSRCTTLHCDIVQSQTVEKVSGSGVGVICLGKYLRIKSYFISVNVLPLTVKKIQPYICVPHDS